MIDETNYISAFEGEPTTKRCRLFSRHNVQFGIAESEVVAIEDWEEPAPLPNAPPSVLGVVGIHGRMLTVLDLAMIDDANADWEKADKMSKKQILALRGDEQLALVADAVGDMIEIDHPAERNEIRELVTSFRNGELEFKLIDPTQLFSSAIQGRERRRRRF